MNSSSSSKSSSTSINSSSIPYWLTNDDAKFQLISQKDTFPTLSTVENFSEFLDSLNQATEEIISSENDWPENLPKGIKGWIPLTRGPLPLDSIPTVPSLDSLSDIFGEAPHSDTTSTPEIFLSIFDYSGYNFSVEHSRIYERTLEPPSSRSVHIAIIERALNAFSPSLDKDLKKKISHLILHLLAWTHDLSDLSMRSYFTSSFDSLKLPLSSSFLRANSGVNWQVYIGNLPMNKENKLKQLKEKSESDDDISRLSVTFRLEEDLLYMKNAKNNLKDEGKVFSIFYYQTFSLNLEQLTFLDDFIKIYSNVKTKFLPSSAASDLNRILNTNISSRFSFYFTVPSIINLYKSYSKIIKKEKFKNLKFLTDLSSLNISDNCADSFFNDIYSWGFDSFYSMGLSLPSVENEINNDNEENAVYQEEIHFPRSIPQSKLLTLEKVKMIACSSRHSLLLTQFGSIFSCGDNSEGALGLGDIFPRNSFTLIEWSNPLYSSSSASSNSPINETNKIIYIAAGNGMIGSHSACIDEKGNLYTWGYSKATGLGSLKLINSPKQVKFPQIEQENLSEDLATGEEEAIGEYDENNEENDKKKNSKKSRVWINEEITQVACGDCFTICVTKNGNVYSWGQWSHGRLGLGAIPMIAPTSKTKSKLAQFQLRPKKINSIMNAISVSCGESHTLCLLSSGHVLSWGKSSLGQLGTGSYSTGLMKDLFKPCLIPSFGSPVFYNRTVNYTFSPNISFSPPSNIKSNLSSNEQLYLSQFLVDEPSEEYLRLLYGLSSNPLDQNTTKINAKKIICGAFHSVVIDNDSNVWTWGARGSPCLGHGDTEITGSFSKRITGYFSISTDETSIIIPKELLLWTNLWTFPRMVQSLKDLNVKQVSTGDLHTAFLLESGELYLCGNGPAIPHFNYNPSSTILESEGKFKQKVVISIPRKPSSYWLRELCTKNISYISGFGMRIFTIFNNETSSHLTTPIFKKLLNSNEEINDDVILSNSKNIDQADDKELSDLYMKGKPDCVIITSEISIFCHRSLLANRSQVLKELIMIGSPVNPLETLMVDILLPEYDRETIFSLVYFLYNDILPNFTITDSKLLKSLVRCGKNLKIFRLQLLAQRYLKIIDDSKQSEDINKLIDEFPPMTLTKDIGSMVGDMEFADIRFIANGRSIYAHRFILEEKSEYFKKLFQSNKDDIDSNFEVMDLVVPDTYQSIIRMLLFIYTSTLPEAEVELEEEESEAINEEEKEIRKEKEREAIIIEDLITAYRYDLFEMKRICENMLIPTPTNWLDLLRVSYIIDSSYLKIQVEMFLRNYPALLYIKPTNIIYENNKSEEEITKSDVFNRLPENSIYLKIDMLSSEFPDFTFQLISNLKIYNNSCPNISSIEYCIENKKISNPDSLPSFPFWTLGVAAICIYLYQHVSKIISLGWMIPVINIGAVLATVIYFYYQYINEGKKIKRIGARI